MTVEEYAELPDDGTLHELVRGEVVTLPRPGYEHGYLTASIGSRLLQHVDERDLGEVVAGRPRVRPGRRAGHGARPGRRICGQGP
jgi:Uma2 family endonuclease